MGLVQQGNGGREGRGSGDSGTWASPIRQSRGGASFAAAVPTRPSQSCHGSEAVPGAASATSSVSRGGPCPVHSAWMS